MEVIGAALVAMRVMLTRVAIAVVAGPVVPAVETDRPKRTLPAPRTE
jgi:hypothetical protein